MAREMAPTVTPVDLVSQPHQAKQSAIKGSCLHEKERTKQNGQPIRGRMATGPRPRRKEETLFRLLCGWVVDNQLGISINLLLLLFGTHLLVPRARPYTKKFLHMSNYDEAAESYIPGTQNIYFVLFWLTIITGLRVALMEYLLKPIARRGGITSKKGEVRFAEQGWLCIYASASFSLGMYIVYNSPYFNNLQELWTNWPTRAVSPLTNWFYLVQFSFWLQQLFVVHIEDRRKDHWQMLTHHIFTCALLIWSYGFYQTKVGSAILCIMDVVDILLALAKCLNYLNYRVACDVTFGVFMVIWLIARHVIYLTICWSAHLYAPITMLFGCYNFPSADPRVPGTLIPGASDDRIWRNMFNGYKPTGSEVCFNRSILSTFVGLLLALQVLTLIWFAMIIGVAYRVITGSGAHEPRSDDEDEEEEEEEIEVVDLEEQGEYVAASGGLVPEPTKQLQYLEEEVGVEGLHHVKRKSTPVTRSRTRRSGGRASGISLPGHGDHKELLGRIGCDKPI